MLTFREWISSWIGDSGRGGHDRAKMRTTNPRLDPTWNSRTKGS